MIEQITEEQRQGIACFIAEGHDPLELTDDEINVDHILENWAKGKKDLHKLFGNKLILEKEINLSVVSKTEAQLALSKFLDSQKFCKSGTMEKIKLFFDNITLKEAIANQLDDAVLFDGKVIGQKQMKVTKALRPLLPNMFDYDDFSTMYSQFLQQFRIKGVLCLSIHPLDYLTMSDNKSNWSSCHAIGAERQGGNLEYMYDPSTVIAYIKSVQPTTYYYSTEWNNKKWRVLTHIDTENPAFILSKQYPVENEKAYEILKDWLCEVVDIKNREEIPAIVNEYDVNLSFETSYRNFGELLYSDLLRPASKSVLVREQGKKSYITIGAIAKCVKCGRHEVTRAHVMLCQECRPIKNTCSHCGIPLIDDMAIESDELVLCFDCYDKHYMGCDLCGDIVLNERMMYHKELELSLCPACYKNGVDEK